MQFAWGQMLHTSHSIPFWLDFMDQSRFYRGICTSWAQGFSSTSPASSIIPSVSKVANLVELRDSLRVLQAATLTNLNFSTWGASPLL